MASKYICSQCERKFVDWGAEKLEFKCPDCDDSPLEVIGFTPAAKAKAKKKPSLKKRAVKKKATKKKAATKKKVATKKKAATKDSPGTS